MILNDVGNAGPSSDAHADAMSLASSLLVATLTVASAGPYVFYKHAPCKPRLVKAAMTRADTGSPPSTRFYSDVHEFNESGVRLRYNVYVVLLELVARHGVKICQVTERMTADLSHCSPP